MLTVRELIEKLQTVKNKDRAVILQKDGEGNDFSPLADIDGDNVAYLAESSWNGRVGLEKLNKYESAKGYTDEDVCAASEGGIPALVLYPIN